MSEAAVETPVETPAESVDARSEAIALLKAKHTEAESAEPEPAESPAEEAKTEPAAAPTDERVAKRIATAKRVEQRAAREREELRSLKAQIEADRSANEQLRKELDARVERFKLLEQDPVKAFEELKLDPKTFLERLATEHEPNAAIQREIAKERAAREALEKQIKEEREAREKLMTEQARQRQEAQVRAAEHEATSNFVSHLETNSEKYPHLTEEFTPEEIARQAWKVAIEHAEPYKAQFGEYPDDSVIAEYLEAEAAKRAEARNAWRSRLKKASEPGQGTANGATAPLKPRTLTNGNSSVRATAAKQWSPKDAREEAIKIVRQLHDTSTET